MAAAAILAVSGCTSFPGPSSGSDSLFILLAENPAPRTGTERGPSSVEFTGPSSFGFSVGGDDLRAYFIKIKGGHYALRNPAALGVDPAAAAFDVPAGSVFLYPFKLTRVRSSDEVRTRALAPVGPDDQHAASDRLTDWLDYEKWLGREVVGFGPWPPRLGGQEEQVQFDISSTPPGASVTVDDQPWGVTPVTTHLNVGKHLLQLEIPGVALTRTFVNVEGKGEINVSLPVREATDVQRAKAVSEKITILLSAFQNMGSADSDNLAAAFPQVIGSDLAGDQRLSLVDAGELVARGAGVPGRPDFELANERGIDLIVSGYYTARPDGLLVYAALYDVRTEIARTSILYTGQAGLAMFDSIDAMAADFIKGIDRVLPDVRRSVASGATAESRMVTYERRRSQNVVIDRRESLRNVLTIVAGPNIGAQNGLLPNGIGTLAIAPAGLLFEHSLGGPLSLLVGAQPAVAFGTAGRSGVDYTSHPYLDLPFVFGPEYTLSGYNVDMTFGLIAEARYTSAFFDANDGTSNVVREHLLGASLEAQTSARFYLQSRLSQRPSFLYLGFNWFLLGGQVQVPGFAHAESIPLELSFNLGYGWRL